MEKPMNAEPRPVPREREPFDVLGDRPKVGYWVMGHTYEGLPPTAWWRCPFCNGVVPLCTEDEIDADGTAVEVRHYQGNREGSPMCSWERPLKLLHYQIADLMRGPS